MPRPAKSQWDGGEGGMMNRIESQGGEEMMIAQWDTPRATNMRGPMIGPSEKKREQTLGQRQGEQQEHAGPPLKKREERETNLAGPMQH